MDRINRNLTQKIKEQLRPAVRWLEKSWLSVPCYFILNLYFVIRVRLLGRARIAVADIQNVEANVTFIYKSFNRQKMAKRLYKTIKSYYPNASIIIADDSEKPLVIPGADIIHLPFNSGLSKGLIAALDKVKTEYVMRMDDDELLTPRSSVHDQLKFLQTHSEVDLCAIQLSTKSEASAEMYNQIKMNKKLIIPAGTVIDGRVVVYKAANCFLVRTAKLRQVGYDPNIRMIDHHEFFYRAAGVIVSVNDPHAYVFHCHNRFDREYHKYRHDTEADSAYIRLKHRGR
ncbi:MAG: glycosyltransferase [Thermoguttaceae bacterium]|nr:glycosyltransferase [Thermoguttaceae bacterium]MBR5759396.1 glycosyltransferase [Thermoguttaceae bacterium]